MCMSVCVCARARARVCLGWYILEHYRGPEFAIPSDDPKLEAYYEWCRAVFAQPCVKSTLAEKDPLIVVYKRYADGSAKSKVGEAVMKGKAAHDLDDL